MHTPETGGNLEVGQTTLSNASHAFREGGS